MNKADKYVNKPDRYQSFMVTLLNAVPDKTRKLPFSAELANEILSYTKDMDDKMLSATCGCILNTLSSEDTVLANGRSLYYLGRMLGSAELILAKREITQGACHFITFMREGLFRCLLKSRWVTHELEVGLYVAGSFKNTSIVKRGYADLGKRFVKEYRAEMYWDGLRELDCLFLAGKYAEAFASVDKAKWAFEIDHELTVNTVNDYKEFLSCTDKKNAEEKKAAWKLSKRVRHEWPTMSYYVMEAYDEYNKRRKIAERIVKEPDIAKPRKSEEGNINRDKAQKKFRKSLLIIFLYLAVIGIIALKVYSYFAGNAERQNMAVLIGFLGLMAVFIYCNPLPFVFGMFFYRNR